MAKWGIIETRTVTELGMTAEEARLLDVSGLGFRI